MSTHRHFDKICCVIFAFTLIITLIFVNAEALGVQKVSTAMGYENKLFDTSKVHEMNIIMDDWEDFLKNCKSEEYYECAVTIDGEVYKNIAIRGKGNTSLTLVESYGNDRYSFKMEFDHYDKNKTYHGLDKLCLNNIIQDNTYMKDYLTYQMMNDMGVAAPLCSYVYITVNGEEWGLYLAVEGVEESFLQRNYGKDYGELYKPDSMNMGGGRGNGRNFNMEDALADNTMPEGMEKPEGMGMPEGMKTPGRMEMPEGVEMPEGMEMPGRMEMPEGMEMLEGMKTPEGVEMPEGMEIPESGMRRGNGENMHNGSDDVLLKYINDQAESYANIFDNAKTDVSETDKKRLIEALKRLSEGENLDDTVDVESVIRYFVVHNFVLNFDSYTGGMIHNYYLYEKDGQMQMIPWDYNLAFGGFQSMGGTQNLVNYPIDSPVSGGNIEDRPMIAWIFADQKYTELYHRYFAEFLEKFFDNGYFQEMMDEITSMIAPYVEKDPAKFCTYEEFETGAATLREFCLLRAESVRGQLDGTIGSTSDTQKAETLIDAGDLQIGDMGTMGNAMGGGGMLQHRP